MLAGFMSQSKALPTHTELRHAIMRNFDGLEDVDPIKVFEQHLREILPTVRYWFTFQSRFLFFYNTFLSEHLVDACKEF